VLADLEGLSGELAARRITSAEVAAIKARHQEMVACFASQDLSGYYRLNAQIHAAINDAARNPVLAKTYREINARVQSLRFRTNQNGSKWQRAVQEHEEMLVALEARDPVALRAILIEHLLRKRHERLLPVC
jgi:DNA-binding GntR family transcriptional regulator